MQDRICSIPFPCVGEQHLLIPQLLAMPKVVKENFQNLDVYEEIADCRLHIIDVMYIFVSIMFSIK